MSDTVKVTIITGVAGTTGSEILRQLLKESEDFYDEENRVYVGIDNFFRGTLKNIEEFLENPKFIFFENDFRKIYKSTPGTVTIIKELAHQIGKSMIIDEIYHMAAVVPTKYFYEAPELTYEINCQGTIDLFKWALSYGVKRFIVGSTSEVYGHISENDLPATEATPSNFDSVETSTRWSYAEGKLLTEHVLNKLSEGKDIKVCHLRFANTYGPQDIDDNHVIPYFIRRVVRNEVVHINENASDFYRTFLYNSDSAKACIEVMRKGRSGFAYNVGGSPDQEISIDRLLKTIRLILDHKFGIVYNNKIVKDVKRSGDPRRRVLNISRLVNHTEFTPRVSLGEGVVKMCNAIIEDERKSKEVK